MNSKNLLADPPLGGVAGGFLIITIPRWQHRQTRKSEETFPVSVFRSNKTAWAAQRQASAGARDGVKGKGTISLRALRCMR